jgi:PleD family two-component response regulator
MGLRQKSTAGASGTRLASRTWAGGGGPDSQATTATAQQAAIAAGSRRDMAHSLPHLADEARKGTPRSLLPGARNRRSSGPTLHSPPMAAPATVLVVDDDRANLESVARIIQHEE